MLAANDHDTDGDGIPDTWELRYGLNPDDPRDAEIDVNGDGLSNLEEYERGYDPLSQDTDGDGVLNTAETGGLFGFITDPLLNDTDSDGLNDLIEVLYYVDFTDERDLAGLTGNTSDLRNLRVNYSYPLDPLRNDTDRDGLEDGDEVSRGTSPILSDTDRDGLGDGKEVNEYGTDPLKVDTDGDWLSDLEEVTEGDDGYVTDPLDPDTDDDGIIDGEESMPLGTTPIPPSTHALSFEEFVSGNLYAGEYLTTMGRVVKTPSVGATGNSSYTIELDDPFKTTTGVHMYLTRGNTTFHWVYDGDIRIFDDDLGFSIEKGDVLLIVGLAGWVSGIKRPITVGTSANDSQGCVYLVIDPVSLSKREFTSMDHIKLRYDITATSSPVLLQDTQSGQDEEGGEAEVDSTLEKPVRIFIEADPPSRDKDGNMTARLTTYLTDVRGIPIDPSPPVSFKITAGDGWINGSTLSVKGAFTSVNITTATGGVVNVTASSSELVSDEISIDFGGGNRLSRKISYMLVALALGGIAFMVIRKWKKGGSRHWVVVGAKKGKGNLYVVKIKKDGESRVIKLERSEYAELRKNKKIEKDGIKLVIER